MKDATPGTPSPGRKTKVQSASTSTPVENETVNSSPVEQTASAYKFRALDRNRVSPMLDGLSEEHLTVKDLTCFAYHTCIQLGARDRSDTLWVSLNTVFSFIYKINRMDWKQKAYLAHDGLTYNLEEAQLINELRPLVAPSYVGVDVDEYRYANLRDYDSWFSMEDVFEMPTPTELVIAQLNILKELGVRSDAQLNHLVSAADLRQKVALGSICDRVTTTALWHPVLTMVPVRCVIDTLLSTQKSEEVYLGYQHCLEKAFADLATGVERPKG